ncbi:MAG: roadblock/LC7 domain-containing protein [candidate division Zixibacteria bacterium]|nr:roadblock/LC7 domain-containing protein [candidate division Zixibacteria bacterium]
MHKSVDLDERIETCEEILVRNPDSFMFAALSDAYRKKGELAKAFSICNRGLKLHPEYGPGHLVMAKINMERGMQAEAEKELFLAIQAYGKTKTTELLLAQIFMKKGQIKDAEMILEKLKAADPENQVVKDLLNKLKEEADLGRAGFEDMMGQEGWQIDKIAGFKDATEYLKLLPFVLGALVVGEDGLVVEGKLNPQFNREVLGAIAITIFKCAKDGMLKINFGELEQILIEVENFTLWVMKFEKYRFVLCCSAEVNLGALKIRMAELFGHMRSMLAHL